ASASTASTSSTLEGTPANSEAESKTSVMQSTICGNLIFPSKNASAASSFTALYTAGKEPLRATSAANCTAEKASPTGRNCHCIDCVKSNAGCASGTRYGQFKASEIGNFIEGGDA